MIFSHTAPRALAALVALLLALPPSSWAGAQTSPRLRIEILEGETAINVVRQRSAREPVVRVVDENDNPVAGAVVAFTLPSRGAGATFSDGSRLLVTTTDAQGQATATGVTANSTEGSYQINVTASHQGLTATAAVTQANAVTATGAGSGAGAGAGGGAAGATAGGLSTKLLLGILIAAGAGGAAAAVAATGGNNNTGNPGAAPQATISIGQPTAGPPGR